MIVNLQFYARREEDQTWTLCIDAPTGATVNTENLPLVVGEGYDGPEAIKLALIAALTAPSVAEDRVAALEAYAGPMSETIDAVNAQGDTIGEIGERLRQLEEIVAGLQQQAPQTALARPRIPNPMRKSAPPALRQAVAARPIAQDELIAETDLVQPLAVPPGPPRRPASDAPRPDFERGTFQPHQPVARVGRGPGSGG